MLKGNVELMKLWYNEMDEFIEICTLFGGKKIRKEKDNIFYICGAVIK